MLGSDNVDKIGTILCVPWVDTYTMVGVEEKKAAAVFSSSPFLHARKAADFLPLSLPWSSCCRAM